MVCSKLAELAFGATLSETLRESDRVFFGMRDEGVQKRLHTKADLTFAKVLEIAEIADAQNSCRVSQNRNKTEVHQVAAPCTKKGETVRPRGLHATGVEERMILNSAGSETKFANFTGNGGTLRRRVVQRKGQKEQVLERVYPQETTP